MKLVIDAATFAKAAKLAAAIVEKRNTIPILSNAMLVAEGGALTISATDLDSALAITLPCLSIEVDGALTVPAYELADLVGKAAKEKGAQVELSASEGKLNLISGRARFALSSLPVDNFPVFAAWEAAEAWEAEAAEYADFRAEGVTMGETAPKKFAKVAKYVGATAAQFTRRDSDGEADRYRMECFANAPGKVFVTFETKLAPPCFAYSYRSSRPAFSFDTDSGRIAEAQRYLRGLRASLGLPLVGGDEGTLQHREGLALGLTVGAGFHDCAESRPMPEDWAPPAGTPIEAVKWCEGATQCEVEGVEYNRMHDGAPWSMRYVPEGRPGYRYPDGAYSLPMPAGQRRVVSAMVAEIEGGETVPVGLNTRGQINLTAEQLADLCGPVDPSTFVDIEPGAFDRGRRIATGDAARRFNLLQADHVKRLRKIAKAPRTPERLELYAAELAAFAPVIAALVEGADVVDAAIEAAGGLPREEAPAAPVKLCEFKPAGPGFHIAVISPAAPEPMPEPIDAPEPLCPGPEPIEEAAADPVAEDDGEALVQLLADCAPPPMPAPAATGALERRLARLEAALGLADTPKRSPAHAAAIRRAWFWRGAQRNARAWALSEVAQKKCAQDKAAALQGQLNSDCERLASIETAVAAERVELVAEIDRLRGLEGTVLRLGKVRTRTARRGAAMRREIARTRAERDGLAANLQAMSRRVVADSALIERLQPAGADRPRIILSSR